MQNVFNWPCTSFLLEYWNIAVTLAESLLCNLSMMDYISLNIILGLLSLLKTDLQSLSFHCLRIVYIYTIYLRIISSFPIYNIMFSDYPVTAFQIWEGREKFDFKIMRHWILNP